jgi:deoxyribodipyrimidine photolyase-related protein
VTPLYWAFLARHEDRLRDNPRMRVPLAALRRRPAARRVADVEVYERVAAALAAGRAVEPR